MAEDLSIHLKAQLSEDPEKRSIPFLVSRLIDQKGGFRNVTEESLEAEIRAGTTDWSPADDGESSEDEAEEEKPRPEQLREAKANLVQYAMEAYNESAHALDMVSLLISKTQPAHAEPTISPFLKSTLPLGCLGVETVQPAPVLEGKSQDDKAVSFGWKMQSLNNAADELLKSATRLEEEVRQETEYWEQALSIKDRGWAVCRLPRERHTLGVRYGFHEAAPEFRDKGMAALRSTAGGCLELDLALSEESTTQRIRARVLQKDRTIAISPSETAPPAEDRRMEDSILAARNGIFDAELFHEIYKEGRGLMNRGVMCLAEGISLPLGDDKMVLLELVGNEEMDVKMKHEDQIEGYDHLPQLVVLALRIMLCHAHRQRYNRRTSTPAPLGARKEQEPMTPILQPILSHLQHRATVRSCRKFIEGLTSIFDTAGLALGTSWPSGDSWVFQMKVPTDSPDLPLVETLVKSLCGSLDSQVVVTVPSKATIFTINVRTDTRGTSFIVNKKLGSAPANLEGAIREETFWSSKQMEEYLCHFLAVDLLQEIEKSSGKWVRGSLQGLKLATEEDVGGSHCSLAVHLNRERLLLTSTVPADGRPHEERQIWRRDDVHEGHDRGFKNAVAELNRRIAPRGST